MITLLSYPGGMSGDFITTQAHKDSKYIQLKHHVSLENRYQSNIFNELNIKNTKGRPITKTTIDEIKTNAPEGKHCCIPIHFFSPIPNKDGLNLIRIESMDPVLIRIGYALLVLKNQYMSKDEFVLSQKKGIDKHDSWEKYSRCSKNYSHETAKQFQVFDVGDIIYGDSERQKLADLLECEFNNNIFEEYAQKNIDLINSFNIDIYSLRNFERDMDNLHKEYDLYKHTVWDDV